MLKSWYVWIIEVYLNHEQMYSDID